MKDFVLFGRAELPLGRSRCVLLQVSAPEASGVKTPDQTILFVGTEVPTSEALVQDQRDSN